MWNFPNCGGCLDGKHIAVANSSCGESFYFNHKGYHVIVLLGLVDANMDDQTVANMNFVFIAGYAIALRETCLKPFPRTDFVLCYEKRCVENLFGGLAARYRIFYTNIKLAASKVEDILMAFVILHSFLQRCKRTQYIPWPMLHRDNLDEVCVAEGGWRQEQLQTFLFGS
ncbi:hypothetical protein PR048_006885 [Dryococelus australis]|uniref:DDE Tnp4 domain-containing protein n=1 Tax=Dryococelus australis TaxID=614101 RepID=A0ABQ9IC67_9NEOP|nr:hypothetical protein PR048_006885 [Dryococelus australis]